MNIIEFPTKGEGWKQQFIEQMKKKLIGLDLDVELTDEQWEIVADEWWEWYRVWTDGPIVFSGDAEQLKKDLGERIGLVLIAASGSLIKIINAIQHGTEAGE